MMQGAVLKRLGIWVAVIAVVGLLLASLNAPIAEELATSQHLVSWLRLGAVVGLALVALGFLIDAVPRRRCVRCGHAAVAGTVFCSRHRRELQREAHAIASRRAKENREW